LLFFPTRPIIDDGGGKKVFGFNLGGQELALIGIAVLLLFGAKRLPEVFRSLGQGISEFKRASREVFRELEDGQPAAPPQARLPEGGQQQKPASGQTAESSAVGSGEEGHQ
jgi:sec-independent protein translocase protein TatA